jgi:hypothetical protein
VYLWAERRRNKKAMKLADQLKKKESNAQCRIPALILHGDDAQKFEALVSVSNLSATKLAAKLIGHVLATDASIKELLASQSAKPAQAKKDSSREQQKDVPTVQPSLQRIHG